MDTTKKRRGNTTVVTSEDEIEDDDVSNGTQHTRRISSSSSLPVKMTKMYLFTTFTLVLIFFDTFAIIMTSVYYSDMATISFMIPLKISSIKSHNTETIYAEGPTFSFGAALISMLVASWLFKAVSLIMLWVTRQGRRLGFHATMVSGGLSGFTTLFVLASSGLGYIDNPAPSIGLFIFGCGLFCYCQTIRIKEASLFQRTRTGFSSGRRTQSICKVVKLVFYKMSCFVFGCFLVLSPFVIVFTPSQAINVGTLPLKEATLYFSLPIVALAFQIFYISIVFLKVNVNIPWDVSEIMHFTHTGIYFYVLTGMIIYGVTETRTFDQIATFRALLFPN